MLQRVFVGTSGYNYPEWRGTFYPEKFSTDTGKKQQTTQAKNDPLTLLDLGSSK